jgi:hypothetical protein
MRNTLRIAVITMLFATPMAIAAETHHCMAAKDTTCCTKAADCCTTHEACCKEGAACCAKECKSAGGTACAMNKDSKACNHDTGCTKSCCSAKK